MIARHVHGLSGLAGVLGVVLAIAITAAPIAVLIGTAALVVLGGYFYQMRTLPVWQQFLQMSVVGLVTLNYGFANLALFNVPVAHALAVAALALALYAGNRMGAAYQREPAFWAAALLLALSMAHLVFDLPRYGLLALRDASFIVESSLLIAGYWWARDAGQRQQFFKFLAYVFIFNFIYTLTFPLKPFLLAHSPVSGVFRDVSLFGFYAGTSLFLVAGGFYFLVAGAWLRTWPRWVLLTLAVGQLGWSLVMQDRAMYIGFVLLLLIAALAGRWNVVLKAATVAVLSMLILFSVISMTGIEISGRITLVDARYFFDHLQSLIMKGDSAGIGSNQWRVDVLHQTIMRWRSSIGNMIYGEGFGQPLIEFYTSEGIDVRQPHNTHVTILARLGAIGLLLWAWFVVALFMRIWLNLRALRSTDGVAQQQLLVLFVFLLLGLLYTSVQPWLEFSYGAIPFFVIAGFTLGYLRFGVERSMRKPCVEEPFAEAMK